MSLFQKPKGKHDKEVLAYQKGYSDAQKELGNKIAVLSAERNLWKDEYNALMERHKRMLKWEAEDDNT